MSNFKTYAVCTIGTNRDVQSAYVDGTGITMGTILTGGNKAMVAIDQDVDLYESNNLRLFFKRAIEYFNENRDGFTAANNYYLWRVLPGVDLADNRKDEWVFTTGVSASTLAAVLGAGRIGIAISIDVNLKKKSHDITIALNQLVDAVLEGGVKES